MPPNQALPANPVKNTGRKKREYSGAGKLGLSRRMHYAELPSVVCNKGYCNEKIFISSHDSLLFNQFLRR
jgi:hypothetical protein